MVTAKLVSRASRQSSQGGRGGTGGGEGEAAAAASRLQGALAGEEHTPFFLGGIRAPAAEAITDAMGAAIATGAVSSPQPPPRPPGAPLLPTPPPSPVF